MSVLGVLGVVFVVLKLLEVITWSWWLVLSPFFVSAVLWVLVFAVAWFFPFAYSPRRRR